MTWKRSKDGGLDYNTTLDTRYRKAKQQLFDPMASAHTMTVNGGLYPKVELDRPLTAHEKIQNLIKRISDELEMETEKNKKRTG